MRICICGGGSLGHVCAGVFASHDSVEVSLLTGKPELWNDVILVEDCVGKIYEAGLGKISSDPEDVVPGCDMVLICQPGFLIEKTLNDIAPFIKPDTIIGSIVSSTGFFFTAHEILPSGTRLFGFQRTPFIARVKEYGKSAFLLGYKPQVSFAAENIPDVESFRILVEDLFRTPANVLASHYEASLTNSNPILHTGRLYSLWHDWDGTPYDHNILFYKEWTDDASRLLIEMDSEFMLLLQKLDVSEKAVPSLLEYYESYDAASLTAKISSIKAFETILSPMVRTEKGWVPDFTSRYFTEDFPYGLRIIKELAQKNDLPTPVIDKVLEWGLEMMSGSIKPACQ